MNAPKIRKDLIMMLGEIHTVNQKPVTLLVDELLRPQVVRLYQELFNQNVPEQLTLFKEGESEPLVSVSYTRKRKSITSPADVFRLCFDMQELMQERIDVLLLNTKNFVTRRQTVFLGTLNASMIHPREVFAPAIEYRAANIIVVHNHPSGNPEPSHEDIKATEVLKETARIVNIPLLDHIIIGETYTSLKEQGYV